MQVCVQIRRDSPLGLGRVSFSGAASGELAVLKFVSPSPWPRGDEPPGDVITSGSTAPQLLPPVSRPDPTKTYRTKVVEGKDGGLGTLQGQARHHRRLPMLPMLPCTAYAMEMPVPVSITPICDNNPRDVMGYIPTAIYRRRLSSRRARHYYSTVRYGPYHMYSTGTHFHSHLSRSPRPGSLLDRIPPSNPHDAQSSTAQEHSIKPDHVLIVRQPALSQDPPPEGTAGHGAQAPHKIHETVHAGIRLDAKHVGHRLPAISIRRAQPIAPRAMMRALTVGNSAL